MFGSDLNLALVVLTSLALRPNGGTLLHPRFRHYQKSPYQKKSKGRCGSFSNPAGMEAARRKKLKAERSARSKSGGH